MIKLGIRQLRFVKKWLLYFIFFQIEQSNMSKNQITVDSEIPEYQIKKIQALYKQKNRLGQKKSIDKRGSIKLKNLQRQSGNFTKQQLTFVETLAIYFQNVDKNIELIEQFCEKRRIHFLKQLKRKISHQEFKSFLSNLQLYKVTQGCKLQEEGKYHSYHYIVIDGCITAYQQKKLKDDEKEYLQKFDYEVGEAILSNLLQTHKANPYTNKAKKLSLLLRFNEDLFAKYLKRIFLRQCDENLNILSHTLVFKGIPQMQLKKFLPYCNIRRFRYNQIIYQEEDRIKQLFMIMQGQAEICYEKRGANKNKERKNTLAPLIVTPSYYKVNHQMFEKKQIKIVRVGKNQIFGLEAFEIFEQNYYQHHTRVTSDELKVLAIGLDILYEMQLQNPIIEQNLNSYLKRINCIHSKLLQKSQNLTIAAPQKKKKRKRRIKRKAQNSLQWWGLAAKIQEDTKKYRLPTPPKNVSQKNLRRKQPLQFAHRTSKLDYFKKRLFEEEIQGLEEVQAKQNNEPSYSLGLIPKLQKVKIKMISSQPKVINNAERVKKKLLQYAKNKDIFCDKLQLQ